MKLKNLFIWLSLFSIAMGFLESSVVIYLREILYPEGFSFPLAIMEGSLAVTEILREAATIIMLISVAVIAGKSFSVRFAWFIYCFAIWDISYYIFLKVLINWPSSFFEWDILFLLPVTWTGPVISPLMVSVLMIILSAVILYHLDRGVPTRLKLREWLMLVGGAVIVIFAFSLDFSSFILDRYSPADIWNMPIRGSVLEYARGYIPGRFNWWLFSAGNVLIIFAILMLARRLNGLRHQ